MASDIRFKEPFTCFIGCPTESGKTTFCIRYLQNLDTLCTGSDFLSGIIWCCIEQSAVPQKQVAPFNKNFQDREGLPENFKNIQGLPCLFILEDLLNEGYSRAVCDLFTKGSHHRKLSVILITQNFFHQAPHCRFISLNAKYLVALETFSTGPSFHFSHAKCSLKPVSVCVTRIEMRLRIRMVI
jgi:hypothetical protein